MKDVDEGFISKRNRRSSFQSQEGIMKIYLLRVIQSKMNLSRLEVFHTNIIVIMFFMRELLVPYAPLHIACEQALCFHLQSFPPRDFFTLYPNRGPVHRLGYILRRVRWDVCLFLASALLTLCFQFQ